jgi:hypothetical protein
MRGLLLVLVCLVLAPRAVAETQPDDGVPSGTVAFFSFDGTGGNCPAGWVPATQAQGRLIVGVTEPDQVGLLVGTPLADQEDRTHAHSYESVVTLPARNIAGADGGNQQGAQSGDHPVAGTTAAVPTGLPFQQLLVCEKS